MSIYKRNFDNLCSNASEISHWWSANKHDVIKSGNRLTVCDGVLSFVGGFWLLFVPLIWLMVAGEAIESGEQSGMKSFFVWMGVLVALLVTIILIRNALSQQAKEWNHCFYFNIENEWKISHDKQHTISEMLKYDPMCLSGPLGNIKNMDLPQSWWNQMDYTVYHLNAGQYACQCDNDPMLTHMVLYMR